MSKFLRRVFFTAIASAMLTPAMPSIAQADTDEIVLSLNHARVIKLSRPASTVIVGNPEIADATVGDPQTIVLTGQGFGRTNLVILDSDGAPIFDESVAVSRDDDVLRIYRRSSVETLACNPFCEGAYLTEAEEQAIERRLEANRNEALYGN
ncbi:MAG: pilus assembly protein N-terminal domain-containing protein [Pseudomonadota bacterium]